MALETGTYISDLVATNPTGSDPLAFADDHLRLLKGTLKNTFPNVTGAISKTHTQINDGLEKAGGTMTGPLVLAGAPTADLQAATKKYIDDAIVAARQNAYPVGSIYVNAGVNTNPATLLGFGTWVAFGAGRVLVGLNGADPLFDALEETGGSADAVVVSHTHTATVTDPGHVHAMGQILGGNGIYNFVADPGLTVLTNPNTASATTGITVANSTTGSSGTNANIQPYITVAMWKRTA